jgi:hypothetical protein
MHGIALGRMCAMCVWTQTTLPPKSSGFTGRVISVEIIAHGDFKFQSDKMILRYNFISLFTSYILKQGFQCNLVSMLESIYCHRILISEINTQQFQHINEQDFKGGKMWTTKVHYIHAHAFVCMHKPTKEDTVGFDKTSARSHRYKCH